MNKSLLLLSFLLLFFGLSANAQCPPNEVEISIVIEPDIYPQEISWQLVNNQSGALIGSGFEEGGVFCVPASECVAFTVFDSFGDGIFSPGFCSVSLDGNEVFNTNGQPYSEQTITINCPPGTSCTSPLTVTEGTYTAPDPNFWYVFTADSTGNYTVSTCDLGNTCDTKIYAYEACPFVQDEGPIGAIAYNNDFCGTQSEITLELEAGESLLIRIGDFETDCLGESITWRVFYSGPIVGCMDTLACNFNPLASVADNTLCEYPPPGENCDGPDLAPGYETLSTNIFIDNNHVASPCEVDEGCILGTGTRKLLKYGVTIWNLGNQPYYPGTADNNPDAYEWAECHGHFHYIGFAESYLYDADFQQVDFARKTSYAIINTDCLPGVTPDGPALAPGCGDTYGAGYECQWVDITDVSPGTYYLVLRVNGPQVPDYLGRVETTFDNNAISLCLNIGELPNGDKFFDILDDCPPFVDCMGVPLGNNIADCAGDCNGSRIRGDLDIDTLRTDNDLDLYMTQIVAETIDPVQCHQLTNDSTFTVLDAARLNACLRFMEGDHTHVGSDGGGNHAHCNFPFHIVNEQQSVVIGLENMTDSYFDVRVKNVQAFLQGFELDIEGVTVDSVQNLVANFAPAITFNPNGHLMALALDEFPLNKYFDDAVLRVFYSNPVSNTVCIGQIYDAVNGDGHRIAAEIGDCTYLTAVEDLQENVRLNLVPNPTSGLLTVNIEGGLLGEAQLRLTDPTGRVLWQEKKLENRRQFSTDLSGFPEGVYFLTVENERFVKTERVIVAKY